MTFIMIKLLLFTILVVLNAKECDSPILTNLNKYKPNENDILTDSEPITNGEFCKNLKTTCCTQDALKEYETVYQNFLNEVQRRNYEVLYRYNDWMLDTLRQQDNILNSIDLIDQLTQTVSDQQYSTLDAIDQINVNSNTTEQIPLPTQYEKYRKDIANFQESVLNQSNSTKDFYKRIMRFDFFENTSFYYTNDQGMGRFNKSQIQLEFQLIQQRMRDYVKASTNCMPILLSHFAGLRCISCDANIDQVFEVNQGQLFLNAFINDCDLLKQKCYDYVDVMDKLNTNIDMKLLSDITAVIPDSLLNDDTQISFEQSATLLIQIQEKASSVLETVLYYEKPLNCSSSDMCDYLCQNWLTSVSVDLQAVYQDQLYMKSYQSPNQYTLNISQIVNDFNNARRILKEGGMCTVIYNNRSNNHSRDTIQAGFDTNAQLDFQGDFGLKVFNLSGEANSNIDTNNQAKAVPENFYISISFITTGVFGIAILIISVI